MNYLDKIKAAADTHGIEVSFTRNKKHLKNVSRYNPTPDKKLHKVMFFVGGSHEQMYLARKMREALAKKCAKNGKCFHNSMNLFELGHFQSDGFTFVVDAKSKTVIIYK